MKAIRIVLAGAALWGMALAQPAVAQMTYTPVTVTGFTQDIVANGPGAVTSSATTPMDVGTSQIRYCYVARDYVSPTGATPISSVPITGLVTSVLTPGLSFQLAPYTGNNALRLAGNLVRTGALTLTTPRAAQEVWVLAASGNGNSVVTMTVTFTDNTTQVFNGQTVPDWFGGTGYAVMGLSRVNYDTNVIENNTADPRMYQLRLPLLAANYGKLVSRVSFDIASTLTQPSLNVLAISLGAGCATAPVGGTTTATPAALCPGGTTALALAGSSTDPFLTYQWQASTNGTTWTSLPGATAATTTATPSVDTWYRAQLGCGSLQATSTPVRVTVSAGTATLAYASGPLCYEGSSEAPVVSPGGGTFSGDAGLVINAATGVIDLAASTPGMHTVSYNGPAPCLGRATTTVQRLASPAVAPNVFSPNGDTRNDDFELGLSGPLQNYELQVYNRWGKRVWQSKDPATRWTGAGSSTGVYYYTVRFTSCTGRPQTLKGWVELLR